MKINIKKLFKKMLILACILYVTIILINQQKTLNSYKDNIVSVEKQIEKATEYKDSLISMKENANSLEYIEQIAREKLNMYMPDEKVYMEPK